MCRGVTVENVSDTAESIRDLTGGFEVVVLINHNVLSNKLGWLVRLCPGVDAAWRKGRDSAVQQQLRTRG